MKDIHIVIVNYKMKEDIDKCLQSLGKEISGADLNVSVCVVDNSSNEDGIRYMLESKYAFVSYVDAGGNVGFGKANNIGFQQEVATYYFVLNPDTQFLDEKNVLSQLFSYMEDNKGVGIVTPRLVNNDGSLQYSCHRFPKFLDQPLRRLNLDKSFKWIQKRVDDLLMVDYNHLVPCDIDWAIGAALFVRKEAMDKVGVFDDNFFMYFEDCDWCRRMWHEGWRVVYQAEVILYHAHRRQSAHIPGIMAVLKSPLTRIHIKSWLYYFTKWKFKRK